MILQLLLYHMFSCTELLNSLRCVEYVLVNILSLQVALQNALFAFLNMLSCRRKRDEGVKGVKHIHIDYLEPVCIVWNRMRDVASLLT